jgi:maltokinase
MSGHAEQSDIPHDELVAQVAAALPQWLPSQRWFGGKDREIDSVSPVLWTTLLDGDPLLLHLIVRVEQGVRRDLYQLLIGSRQSQLPNVPAPASIGLEDGRTCYEASGDADLTACLLDFIAEGARIGSMTFEHEPGADLTTGLRGHPITSEQSNTSLVYGHHHILKLFRKLGPGVNKDLVLHRALHALGSQQIAEPLGSISAQIDGDDATIGMLQRFMPDAADGWVMATTSVRDFMADPTGLPPEELGGDFAGEAYRLGKAVATVHADLARALGTEQAGADDVRRTLDSMLERLDRVAAQVPALARHADAVRPVLERVTDVAVPVSTQPVHGDLHLGQVLRTVNGWLLLDFEGEPAASVAERSALASPLRDVASMLRSFDYAAQQLLVGQPDDPERTSRAMSWARRNRAAFCDGYCKVAGVDPRDSAELLSALELDKAIYEVGYEHANRPDWLTVPLASIERILSEGE